jgi:hypothetical protein
MTNRTRMTHTHLKTNFKSKVQDNFGLTKEDWETIKAADALLDSCEDEKLLNEDEFCLDIFEGKIIYIDHGNHDEYTNFTDAIIGCLSYVLSDEREEELNEDDEELDWQKWSCQCIHALLRYATHLVENNSKE